MGPLMHIWETIKRCNFRHRRQPHTEIIQTSRVCWHLLPVGELFFKSQQMHVVTTTAHCIMYSRLNVCLLFSLKFRMLKSWKCHTLWVSLTGCVSHIVSVILAQGEPGADGTKGEKVSLCLRAKWKISLLLWSMWHCNLICMKLF